MPEEKGLGSKLLGLFVEQREGTPEEGSPAVEPKEKSPAELVAELAGQTARPKGAAPAPAPVHTSTPRPAPSGPVVAAQVDFDAVFKTAGMDSAELDRVRKADELLKSLPEETPVAVKRQIVEAALNTFGFDIAKIVAAAQNQLKALDTYQRLNEQQTAKAITDAQTQIAQLEEKVISLRVDITRKTDQLASVAAAAEGRKGQVHRVLDFFKVSPAPTSPGGAGKA